MAPKGTFKIGGGIEKSLFEALSDTIKDAKKYEVKVAIKDKNTYIFKNKENEVTLSFEVKM